ncbi:MAG: TonB-dependent receptor [Acidobacteriota bacterium]|nr:TonB-dependent receptor [Acidobacteriota bacterium]
MFETLEIPRLPKLFSGIALALALLLGAPALRAQTVTGNITGTVTDSSGATVSGAKAVAHNLDTGVDSPAVTNSAGLYRIQFLPIGRYQVTVQASGFGLQTIPPFTLEIQQTANFNVQLKPGAEAQTVDVTAAAPILNTNDATLGVTFSTTEIENVPLNGLNFSTLTQFIPGAVNTNGNSGQSGNNAIERDTYYSDIPSINGNRSQANNYTLEGIDMNEPSNNLIAYNPAPDALQEVKVLTANSPAEYGNVNGGGVVSVLKSGTNRFHGSAYGYLQNDKINANTWNNDNATPVIPINPFTQAQFGGTFGGPIKRDKLFFFVDYIGSRYHTGGIGQASVFTSAMRTGDFSILLNPPPGSNGQQNTPIQLYDSQSKDPVTMQANFAPYKNNQIPIINPVAKFLFAHPALYPLPNATPTDGVAANNYQGTTRTFTTNNQGDAKIEFDPRASDKITAFYSMSSANDGAKAVLAISFPSVNQYPTKLGGMNWVHILSPSIVNSARIGFTRVIYQQSNPTDPTGLFGLTGNAAVGIAFGAQSDPGYSFQSIGGGITGGGAPAFDANIIDNTFTYTDNLTWQLGRHLISTGVQAIRYQYNYTTNNNAGFLGTLTYSGDFTSNPLPGAVDNTGYGGADFLLNRVKEAAVTSQGIRVGQRQWRAAGFVQDDWKVMPTLTLNIGLRYEYDQPWYEQHNKTGNILLGTGQTVYAGAVPAGAPAGSGICSNRACYQPNYTQFMPRLGFSFQATDRFVLRGGYGATSFFEGDAGNQRLTSITPFVQSVDIKPLAPTAGDASTPPSGGAPRTAQQGFTPSNPGDINFNGSSYNVYPQNIRPAYVQEWSLTTEYALTRSTSLQVGYIGEQGQHIEDYGNVNQYTVNGDPTTAPYFNNTTLGIGSGTLLITEARGMMNYNAFQTTLRQRTSHGLEFTLNYTYSKAMTNSLGNYALNVNGYSGAFQNYYDGHADYGPAGTDVTHNISGLANYALPFGRGRQFLSGANRIVDGVIGGWKISSSGFFYTGLPQSITAQGNNSNSYGVSRANQYRALKIVHRSIGNWFGTDPSAIPCTTPGVDNGVCAFGAPASNSFGTSSNGSVRGPGYWTADASAFKDFHLFSEHVFDVRFDAFNVFNHPSYTNPDTGINDSNFGQAIGVRSQERHIQLSARYSF